MTTTTFNRFAKQDDTGKLLAVEQFGDAALGYWFVDLWQGSHLISSQRFTNERDACTTYALGIFLVAKLSA